MNLNFINLKFAKKWSQWGFYAKFSRKFQFLKNTEKSSAARLYLHLKKREKTRKKKSLDVPPKSS